METVACGCTVIVTEGAGPPVELFTSDTKVLLHAALVIVNAAVGATQLAT